MKRLLVIGCLSLALLAGALSGGCAAAPVHGITLLESHEWRVASIDYVPYTGVPDVSLKFSDGKLTGSAGVNQLEGTYDILQGNKIAIQAHLTTHKTGTPDAAAVEANLLRALGSATSFAAGSEALTLFGTNGLSLLSGAAIVPKPLVGTSWKLQRYSDGAGGLLSVLTSSSVNGVFDSSGMLRGSCGLDVYHCKYAVEGTHMKIETALAVRLPSPPEVVVQEQLYLTTLPLAETYAIERGKLIIRDVDNKTILIFAPE